MPLLAPGDIAVRRRTGELTVRPGAFLCLPDDPAALGPAALPTALPAVAPAPPPSGARTVPDEGALATGLRSALADFLTPVLDAFRPEVRRGPRTLWAMATDAVVEGLWYAGGLLGEEERARTELAALFAPGAPGVSGQPEPRAARPAPECAPFTPGSRLHRPRVRRHRTLRPVPGELLPRLHRPGRGDVHRLSPRRTGLTEVVGGASPDPRKHGNSSSVSI